MAPLRPTFLVLALAVSAGAACYTGPDIGATSGSSSPTLPSGSAGTTTQGLPCEVATFVQEHCAECHGSAPRAGATTTLTSRDALLADFDGRSLGVASVERMRDEASPMPPQGLLAEAEFAAFAKWVEDGMPEGSCDSVSTDTPAIDLKCTSGRFWTESDDEGDELMTPGQACITCHMKEHGFKKKDDDGEEEGGDDDAPLFTAAGTVYPTLHEPDDCFGGPSGTQVIITGADGKKLTLTVNRAGNFKTEAQIALPYKASVVRAGKTRTMKAEQTDGDCNKCHTAEGGDAPGRIVAP